MADSNKQLSRKDDQARDQAQGLIAAAKEIARAPVLAEPPSPQKLAALRRIENKTQAQAATLAWNAAKKAIKAIRSKHLRIRKLVRQPFDEAIKNLKHEEASDVAPYLRVVEVLGPAVEAWLKAEAARVEAANRERLALAERAANEERDRQVGSIRLAAAAAPRAVDRRALEHQATSLERAPLMPVIEEPAEDVKLAGATLRKTRRAVVTDLAAFKAAVFSGAVSALAVAPDQEWLDAQAEAQGDALAIPGVAVVEESSLAATAVRS